jgi:hypothetical protein
MTDQVLSPSRRSQYAGRSVTFSQVLSDGPWRARRRRPRLAGQCRPRRTRTLTRRRNRTPQQPAGPCFAATNTTQPPRVPRISLLRPVTFTRLAPS